MPRIVLRLIHADRSPWAAVEEIVADHFPFLIGRHPESDHALVLPEISRRHCLLELYRGRVWVQDLDSTNGTLLNGREALLPEALHDGDKLRLASLVFEVSLCESWAGDRSDEGALVGV